MSHRTVTSTNNVKDNLILHRILKEIISNQLFIHQYILQNEIYAWELLDLFILTISPIIREKTIFKINYEVIFCSISISITQ